MKRIGFVFRSAPHGTAAGREGLDALLAASALTDDLRVFFLDDGVFHLLTAQQPDRILGRDYIATFRVLPLYDIDACYVCGDALRTRGLSPEEPWILDATVLDTAALREQLDACDVILTF